MLIDRTKNLSEMRSRITSFIRIRGPCLPIHIAKETGVSLLLSSAFLSDLVSQKELKITNMKVGGSPLYHLPGQEPMLENYYQYLNPKEREAVTLLKERKILLDEAQEPSIRVALRAIKDFAIPVKDSTAPEKIFWKFYLLTEQETQDLINRVLKPEVKVEPRIERKEEEKVEPKPETIESKPEVKVEERPKKKPKIEHEKISDTPKNLEVLGEENPAVETETKPSKTKEKVKDTKFLEEIKAYLEKKDIELIEETSFDKKEVIGKVRIDSDLGKITLLLIAHDKKKLNEGDIITSYQKAQDAKMPCFFLSRADKTKKLEEQLEPYKNLVKIEKI